MLARRTPLRRGKPLVRKTRINPRREKPRRGFVRDKAYKELVCSLECLLARALGADRCWGRIDPDHLGWPGEIKVVGAQADDTTCVPMCRNHHGQRTDGRGYFADWTDEQREHWRKLALARTQHAIALKRTGLPRPQEGA